MSENVTPAENEGSGRWTISFIVKVVSAVLIGIILLIFVAGLLLAIVGDAEQMAPRIQIIRDIFLIIFTLLGGFIIMALAILILQVAQLINVLKNEVLPILHDTQDTINTARGTVEFVGSNVTEPIVRAGGFFAGSSVLLREVFGIRRAIQRKDRENGSRTA
jgi:hypothetical protein